MRDMRSHAVMWHGCAKSDGGDQALSRVTFYCDSFNRYRNGPEWAQTFKWEARLW
jgi:hypothetical protein